MYLEYLQILAFLFFILFTQIRHKDGQYLMMLMNIFFSLEKIYLEINLKNSTLSTQ